MRIQSGRRPAEETTEEEDETDGRSWMDGLRTEPKDSTTPHASRQQASDALSKTHQSLTKLKGTRLHWRRAVRRSLLCAFGHRVDGDVRRLLADVVFRGGSSVRLDCNMHENAQNNRVWLARASPKNTPFARTTSRVGRSLRGDFLVWSEHANSHTTWTPQESLGTCKLCLLNCRVPGSFFLRAASNLAWPSKQAVESRPDGPTLLLTSLHHEKNELLLKVVVTIFPQCLASQRRRKMMTHCQVSQSRHPRHMHHTCHTLQKATTLQHFNRHISTVFTLEVSLPLDICASKVTRFCVQSVLKVNKFVFQMKEMRTTNFLRPVLALPHL